MLRTPEATVVPLIHHRPTSGLEGKFSLEYAAAAALLDAYPGFGSFTDAAVRREAAQRLVSLVETKLDPGGSWLLDGELEAEIHTGDGTILRASQQFPPGSPARPPSAAQLQAKLADCVRGLDTDPASWTWENAAGVLRRWLPEQEKRAGMDELNEDERAMVELVRDFVNREVRPVVRELEHANTYPDKLIEQMKQLGIFGLAIPEPWGDAQVSTPCYARITEELARGWMSLAGAMGGHTVVAKLLLAYGTAGAEARLPAADGHRRAARDDGADRAGRRVRPAGDAHRRPPRRGRLRHQRVQDLDHQRPPLRADRAAVQDRPGGPARARRASASSWPSRAPASPSPATCPSSATRASRAASSPSTTSGSPARRCWASARARASRR